MPNVVLTPHIGGATWNTEVRQAHMVADDLEMGGVLAAASIEDAAVETLRAGSDLFPVCHNEEKVWTCFEAVLTAAERDRRFAAIVAEKAARVTVLKKKMGLARRRTPKPSAKTIDKLRRAVKAFTEEVEQAKAATSL